MEGRVFASCTWLQLNDIRRISSDVSCTLIVIDTEALNTREHDICCSYLVTLNIVIQIAANIQSESLLIEFGGRK